MAQFPAVQSEEINTFPNAVAGAGDTTMGVILKGKFPQGAPVNLTVLSIGTGATPITLTNSPSFGVYIRNLSASAAVQVTWTPNAGSSAVIQNLAPGAWIAFAQPQTAAAVVTATPGISALTLQASAAATPVEFCAIG